MSKFIVSARKYRPTTFDEVVGQSHVADTLKNALQSDKLAHSFLFCGPRGVGKTTCARILAKVINCQTPKDKTTPCNECSSCTSFNDNASFNIMELDAASNNSVDDIRNLIDQVRILPQSGTHKVFIIDEVHMLSSQAFNAFLKTLEEPPAHAIFILATTEKHKILPTILSRCQIFDFKRIQASDAANQLAEICRQENIQPEPEALHLIGQKADGAMRDALSIFDKVASSSATNTLTYKDVITNLNILDYEYYFRVVDALLSEDLSKVLLILEEVIAQGFEVDQFIQGLASHMRDLLVCKDQRTISLLDVSDDLKSKYTQQAQYATRAMLLTGLDILNQCDLSLQRATNKRLNAEIALSKINFTQRTIDAHFAVDESVSMEKKTKVVSKPSPLAPPTKAPDQSKKNTPSPQEDVEAVSSNLNTVEESKPEPSQMEVISKTSENPIEKKTFEVAAQPSSSETANKDEAEVSKPTSGAIDLSITGMMAQLEAESKALEAAKENFGIDAIKQIWEDYTLNNPSPSVKTALKRVDLVLESDKKLKVIVPTGMTGEIVNNEAILLDRLRNELGATGLVLKIDINPEHFPDFEATEPKTNLSPKEKYKQLLVENQHLRKLADNLKLEDEINLK